MPEKRCTCCGKVKLLDCYSPAHRAGDGRSSHCKVCRAEKEAARRLAHPNLERIARQEAAAAAFAHDAASKSKVCLKCGQRKHFSGYSPQAYGKHGLESQCKRCKADSAAARRAADPAAARELYHEHGRRYRLRHPEKVKAALAAWRVANLEDVRAREREYQRTHRAQRVEMVRKWRHANPERARRVEAARVARLPRERRDAIRRTAKGARRARKRAAEVAGPVPYAVLAAMMTEAQCVYCGAAATHADHIRPLTKGGWHHETNLVPACRRCNLTKHAKLLTAWDPVRVAHGARVSAKVAAELARQQAEAAA
jgi:5-methylcytosine-specific restriction endonuclease McrA/uncharacterized protein CbrC (UPF0167 family)